MLIIIIGDFSASKGNLEEARRLELSRDKYVGSTRYFAYA